VRLLNEGRECFVRVNICNQSKSLQNTVMKTDYNHIWVSGKSHCGYRS
jgi:hypothetical protein